MAEVALSFVLLVGSGLMFRSFFELQRIDPGFDPHRLLTFQVAGTPQNADTPEKLAVFIRGVHHRLRAIPGAESVTAASPLPLAVGFFPIRWGTEEALADASKFQSTDDQIVLPGYFETMHVPLLEGRTFTDDDNLPGRTFVVIDNVLARKAFHGQSAVGRRILVRVRTPQAEWVQVIGVVAHQHETSLTEPGREQTYFTDGFVGSGRTNFWAIRTRNDPASYGNVVSAAVREVDPQVLVNELQTGDALIEKAQAGTRFSLLLIGVFAMIAGGAGRSRIVRRAGDHGATPHRGDRRTHGSGSRTGQSVPTCGCLGVPSQRDWSGMRPYRRARPDSIDEGDAGGRAGHGPGDVRRDGAAVPADRSGVIVDAGASSGGVGPGEGAERGVGAGLFLRRRLSVREIVSSLRDSCVVCKLTQHCRAGLSHAAASRLDYQFV
jgi:MacB-like protein